MGTVKAWKKEGPSAYWRSQRVEKKAEKTDAQMVWYEVGGMGHWTDGWLIGKKGNWMALMKGNWMV